jgi:hypothetical protein
MLIHTEQLEAAALPGESILQRVRHVDVKVADLARACAAWGRRGEERRKEPSS